MRGADAGDTDAVGGDTLGPQGSDSEPANTHLAGALDPGFGTGGMLSFPSPFDVSADARSVLIDEAGRIVIAASEGAERAALFRLLADGRLDPTFGSGGRTDFCCIYQLYGLVRDDAGRFVTVGWLDTGTIDVVLHRFDADGAVDPVFSAAGISGGPGRATGLMAAGSGVTVVITDGADFVLRSFRADGTPDPLFGSSGVTRVDFGGGTDIPRAAFGTAAGSFLVAGIAGIGQPRVGLARLLSDGRVERLSDADISPGGDAAYALTVDPLGRVVIAGETYNTSGDVAFGLARFDTAGDLDPTFGAGGVLVDNVSSQPDLAYEVVATTDRVIAIGYTRGSTYWDDAADGVDAVAVAYDEAGARDPDFGVGGVLTIDLGSDADVLHACALAREGTLVCVGRADGAEATLVVVRIR
jgi:uncharacterized delta-60 repeat protein